MKQLRLTVSNRKGGTGKTAAAVHIAATLGRAGYDVVVVDLDSQANATSVLLDPAELPADHPTTAEALLFGGTYDRSRGVPLVETLVATRSPGVRLAPGSKRLVGAQLELTSRMGRESALFRAHDGLESVDVIIYDTPPDGYLAVGNALVASTHVLIPFCADAHAMHGLAAIEELVGEVRRTGLNPTLEILGALQVAYDRRERVSRDVRDVCRARVGRRLLRSYVRENTLFNVAGSAHRDVTQLGGEQARRGAEDYDAVTTELLRRAKRTAA